MQVNKCPFLGQTNITTSSSKKNKALQSALKKANDDDRQHLWKYILHFNPTSNCTTWLPTTWHQRIITIWKPILLAHGIQSFFSKNAILHHLKKGACHQLALNTSQPQHPAIIYAAQIQDLAKFCIEKIEKDKIISIELNLDNSQLNLLKYLLSSKNIVLQSAETLHSNPKCPTNLYLINLEKKTPLE